MSKDLTFNSEARKKLCDGVDAIANAVKVTLGAKGRNVVIQNGNGSPHITKDGVTVARSIFLEDSLENIGASLIKEVATKTVDESGDGTTTATVLSQSIIKNGLKAIESGANPISVKKGIDKAVKDIVGELKQLSSNIVDEKSLFNIAKISSNNDDYIGSLISNAFVKVGNDGVITVEESNNNETSVDVIDGVKINRGYLSSYFITNSGKMTAELENPYILMCDKKITLMKELLPLLEKVVYERRPILIISDELDGEALNTLVLNKMNGNIQVCAIKSPEFGDKRRQIMEDISTLTNGTFISNEIGVSLESVELTQLGSAKKVIVSKDSCLIIGGNGDKEQIEKKCDELKKQIEKHKNEEESEFLKTRLAKLANGVAVLKIGGVTETEIREKKDRIEDALCATKAAIEEGYVAGGGVSFIKAALNISYDGLNDDEKIGFEIVKKSIEEPFVQILKNGGVEPFSVIKQVKDGEYGFGYNIKTNTFENLLEAGVIDPTKVLRVALENSASIAAMFLTTECVISENKNK